MLPELAALRHQIDKIDKALVDLLAQRMTVVTEIAKIKNQYSLPIYARDRENFMVSLRREEAVSLGISPDLIEDVFRRIIHESYYLEKRIQRDY